MAIDLRNPVIPIETMQFLTNEGTFTINVTLFKMLAESLQWHKIRVIQMLRIVSIDEQKLSLKSAKDITEYLFSMHQPPIKG